MRPEKRPIGYELVLHISADEARELASGIQGLYRKRGRGMTYEWVNTAVAALDSHLTQYLNSLVARPDVVSDHSDESQP